MNTSGIGSRTIGVALAAVALAACGGGGAPSPTAGFGMLTGRTVLVLPVQYAPPGPGGWLGGARDPRSAARMADAEIAFALQERAGRVTWVLPERQREVLRRRPSFAVDPHALSADQVRTADAKLERIVDPLYGEIRTLAALFNARFALWPLEVYYRPGENGKTGHVAIRTLLLDARGGDILWQGEIAGPESSPGSPDALAAAAQAFAWQVSP